MELLGVGPLEFLLILLLVLIIFSPKDLAKGGKEVGRWMNRLYRSDTWKSMRQVSKEMQDLPNRLAREAQLDELKETEKDLQKNLAGTPYGQSPALSRPKPDAAEPGAPQTSEPETKPSPPNPESKTE
jgi:Sec-independent protein translocase protein TatA